jgi:hypothetical protein
MSPSPGRTAGHRRHHPERVLASVALLAALVVLVQLPGPGNCLKRFTAASNSVADTGSDPRSVDSPGDAGTVPAVGIETPAIDRTWLVTDVASPSRLNPVVDAGTTRAPPPA